MNKGHNTTRKIADMKKGDRVLIGFVRTNWLDDGRSFPDPKLDICEIVEPNLAPGIARVRRRDGTLSALDTSNGLLMDGDREMLVWTDALPVGSDEAVLAYCTAVCRAEHHSNSLERAILLHVERIEDGVPIARPVFPAGCIEGTEPGKEDEGYGAPAWTGDIVGNAAFHPREIAIIAEGAGERRLWIEDPPFRRSRIESVPLETKVGDLVAAPTFRFELDGQRIAARLEAASVVDNFPSREEIGAFMPWSRVPKGWQDPRSIIPLLGSGVPRRPASEIVSTPRIRGVQTALADDLEIAMEIDRAHARAEPDEALVIWYRDPELEGRVSSAILGRSGIVLHEVQDANDYLYGISESPGLWVMEDIDIWSTHDGYEWDSGMNGSVRHATAEDVERFGFTLAELDNEIAEATELDEPKEGIALRYMEMAERANNPEMVPDPAL